jgi:hypothetical protein
MIGSGLVRWKLQRREGGREEEGQRREKREAGIYTREVRRGEV